MSIKSFTTISIAALATLGAFAASVESASARSSHGMRSHGGGHGMMRHGGSRHHDWGHRRHHNWGYYGAPLLVGAGAYGLECYYVRRRGGLYKICQ
jgi:hypothetical protein